MTAAPVGVSTRRSRAGAVVIQVPVVGWSTRVQLRAVVVTLVAMLLAVAVMAWSLTLGDGQISVQDALRSLVGRGDGGSDFIIQTLRLPRGLTALMVGAAFGLSGAIFQRIARNPLASPDIIGIDAGASAAAVLVIVLWEGSTRQTTYAALAGALLTAVLVYGLAYRKGVSGYRLVLVGIGITAVLESLTQYLLTRAKIFEAVKATVWLTGSLNGRSWDHVRPVGWALVVIIPITVALVRQLRVLELGDETAKGLGARVEPVRAALILCGVVLAAIATASAGPVGFVALVSPQIARRLVRARSVALLPSAAIGALLLVSADLVGRRTFAPTELPVGVITAILGAPYLLLLLARANRIGSGG